MTRKTFGIALCVLAFGQIETCALSAKSLPPNYWCTWGTQGSTLRKVQKAEESVSTGDQGVPLQRDNLNEEVLFGKDGWATLFYPNDRDSLYLLLDAGWDLPYNTKTRDVKDMAIRGACIPHPDRFPSLKGTPGERLKALNDKAKSIGWRGIGVWLPCHVYGDMAEGRMLTDDEARKVLADKMRLCREAGVEYWKVDWGRRDKSAAFRRLLTETRDKTYPGLILEHCCVSHPFNDIDIKNGCAQENRGRLVGTKSWEKNRADHAEMLAASDVFRTYDVLFPFADATTLERCVYYSTLAEERKLPVMLNVEGNAMIGAGLGHLLGIMSGGTRTNDACMALAWQKLAPPFGHDTALVTRCSEEVLEDVWSYSDKDCSWFYPAANKTIVQSAPAIVTRGLPLPDVRADGPKPFVCGARYPNGAISLSFLLRTVGGKVNVECLADVTLDARLEKGKPLGIFGLFRTLTLKGGVADGSRIQARQLPYGKARDVTALCKVGKDGSVTIPMAVFEKSQGDYMPNVVIEAHPAAEANRVSEVFEDLQARIDAVAAAGGGRVNVPAGVHRIRPLRLRSGIELHLEKGAVLSSPTNLEAFAEWTDVKSIAYPEALPRRRNASFVFADACHDISITGAGTIDCNGDAFVRPKTGDSWTGWHFERKVPPEKSLPRVVFFAGCSNVVVRGITIAHPPAGWSTWFHACDNLLVEDVKVRADVRYPNNDGIHVNSCRNVVVRNCDIETGDDSIVVRANNRSLAENRVCENVVVSNCTLRSWSAGVRLGWTNDGLIRNCLFRDLRMRDMSVGIAYSLPLVCGTDYGREATSLDNIVFENITMDEVYGRPILVYYGPREKGTLIGPIRNLVFRNVTSRGLEKPMFRARPENPIEGVRFENCRFDVVREDVLPGFKRHGAAAWDRFFGKKSDLALPL